MDDMQSYLMDSAIAPRLSRVLADLCVEFDSGGSGFLAQLWIPRVLEKGDSVLSTQGLPYTIHGVGDLLALFRCASCKFNFRFRPEHPSSMGTVGRVFVTERPEMTRDLQNCDPFAYLRFAEARRCAISSAIFVPLRVAGVASPCPLAVLEVVQSASNAPFARLATALRVCLGRVGLHSPPLDLGALAETHLVRSWDAPRPSPTGGGPLKAAAATAYAGLDPGAAAYRGLDSGGATASGRQAARDALSGPSLSAGSSYVGLHGMHGGHQGHGPFRGGVPGRPHSLGGYDSQAGSLDPGPGGANLGYPHERPEGLLSQTEGHVPLPHRTEGHVPLPHRTEGHVMPSSRPFAPPGLGFGYAPAPLAGEHAELPGFATLPRNPTMPDEVLALVSPGGLGFGEGCYPLSVGGVAQAEPLEPSREISQAHPSVLLPAPEPSSQASGMGGGARSAPSRVPAPPRAHESASSPPPAAEDASSVLRYGQAHRSLTLEDLRVNFGFGLKAAAARLGVCPTTLKRACRRFGISRWPHRRIAKMMRQRAQLPRGDGAESSDEAGKAETFGGRGSQASSAPTTPVQASPAGGEAAAMQAVLFDFRMDSLGALDPAALAPLGTEPGRRGRGPRPAPGTGPAGPGIESWSPPLREKDVLVALNESAW